MFWVDFFVFVNDIAGISIDDFRISPTSDSDFHVKVKGSLLIPRDDGLTINDLLSFALGLCHLFKYRSF